MKSKELEQMKLHALELIQEYGRTGKAGAEPRAIMDAANEAIKALTQCIDAQNDYINELIMAGEALKELITDAEPRPKN